MVSWRSRLLGRSSLPRGRRLLQEAAAVPPRLPHVPAPDAAGRHTAALVEGCDGPTRPVLVGPAGLPFFRRLAADDGSDACGRQSSLSACPACPSRSPIVRSPTPTCGGRMRSTRRSPAPGRRARATSPSCAPVTWATSWPCSSTRRRPAPPSCPRGRARRASGGAVASEGCIVLNVEALDAIHEVNALEGYAVVGPGVVNADLKRGGRRGRASSTGPTPRRGRRARSAATSRPTPAACAASSTASPPTGSRRCRSCCPGGEVMRTGHRTAKGVAGYDLTGLFVGSEGTLGVVTEAVVRLEPAPDPALTALAVFDSLDAARRRHRRAAARPPPPVPARDHRPHERAGHPGVRRLRLPRRLRRRAARAVRPAGPRRRRRARGMPLCWSPRARPTSRSPTTRRSRRRCSRVAAS